MMRVGSLCSGYGGLELALNILGIDVDLRWFAETDKNASKILEHKHEGVPNLGDLTLIDNADPVEIVTAGFPCQPVSHAGKRKGIHDERWLIDDVCRIASGAGADWLLLENVPGILTANKGFAMARVVSALAENGFSAEWVCVSAADVGAPHKRLRWFCLGYSDNGRREQRDPSIGGLSVVGEDSPQSAADAVGQRTQVPPSRRQPVVEMSGSVGETRGTDWGPYTDAIRRWEPIIGRPAPNPTDDQRRLNPRFVEWIMGLEDGWVCDAVEGRSHQLRILGNGVVPQQAAYAISVLNDRISEQEAS